MREELVSGDGNTGTVVDERVDWRRRGTLEKLVGVSRRRSAVVDERVELARAGLVSGDGSH